MEQNKEFRWHIKYNNTPKSMVGQGFLTKEDAKKYLPLYRSKGWTGRIIKLPAPKPLTEEERKDLEELNKFMKGINSLLR